ncbi:MAG: ABC transporter permease [Candidatus Hodarchaeales archaeon]|jgi:ABC-type antimicrobial peptide transport system permease subunit
MFKPTSILFGLKSVIRRKQKNLFAILAVALGVSVIAGIAITDDSLSEGFGTFFTLSLGKRDGSVTYTNGLFNESLADSLSSVIVSLDDVIDSTNILFLTTTTSTEQGSISTGTSLFGIKDSESFGKFKNNDNDDVLISDLDTTKNESYIGEVLADDLRLEVGDEISFSLSFGQISISQTVKVKDIIKNTERGTTGGNLALYMDLYYLQKIVGDKISLIGLPNQPVSLISLKFSDKINTVDEGDVLVDKMEEKAIDLPQLSFIGGINSLNFSTDRITIKQVGKSLAEGLSSMLTIFGFVIVFAGLLLIVNVQLMTVEDRQQQIGMQRAIGTQGNQIILANLTEFIITGIIGGLIGVIGGAVFSKFLILTFGDAFDFDGNLIAVKMDPSIIFIAFFAGFFISLLTGLLPSIRSSRINIVETLRGVENKAESVERGTGTVGLYIGLILVVFGVVSLTGLNGQPWDFPNAYRNLDDAQAIFFATAFLLVGLSVLFSYFVPRVLALNVAGLLLVILPVFHILVVFGEIEEGSGGTNYILGLIFSLIIGNIMLIGLNLSRVADAAQKIFNKSYSAVAMLSFRQMASKPTRSTLTFAIFAVILTLIIFISSWSYSDRYGSAFQVEAQSGGSDILVVTDQSLNMNVSKSYVEGLKETFSDVTFAQSFSNAFDINVSLTGKNPLINPTPNPDDIETWMFNLFAINNKSFWASDQDFLSNNIQINLLLNSEKLNSTDRNFVPEYEEGFEIDDKISFGDIYSQSNIDENANLWKAFAENTYVDGKPLIISFPIADLTQIGAPAELLKERGDSVWLPLKNGSYKEFIIAAYSNFNPLFDADLIGSAEESFIAGIPGAFVNQIEAIELAAFNPITGINQLEKANYFLILGTEGIAINSKENSKLAQDIEIWSNGIEIDSFRNEHNQLFGMIVTSIYELYEIQFDAQFRIFGFLQTFISFGFLVGVLGLLVVSVRSVQERKREIGMMRSLGLKKHEVIISIVMELSVMGIIGLAIGLFSGNLLALGLVDINSGGSKPFLIPWDTLVFYTILTLGAALIAAIIPGRSAAKIPPSEALRYTG